MDLYKKVSNSYKKISKSYMPVDSDFGCVYNGDTHYIHSLLLFYRKYVVFENSGLSGRPYRESKVQKWMKDWIEV